MSTLMQVERLTVKLAANNHTDLAQFIQGHQDKKESLIVEVVRTGLGDCYADRLEESGFSVKRVVH